MPPCSPPARVCAPGTSSKGPPWPLQPALSPAPACSRRPVTASTTRSRRAATRPGTSSSTGAVPIAGGTATVANTTLIQAFGQDGNDTIALDETYGALPNAALFGGNGTDTLIGGSGNDAAAGTGNDVALLGTGMTRSSGTRATAATSSRVRPASTGSISPPPMSTRASTSRPTAGACACPAMSAASRWTSTTSSGSIPRSRRRRHRGDQRSHRLLSGGLR